METYARNCADFSRKRKPEHGAEEKQGACKEQRLSVENLG
jgi:hypothetical protein